MSRRPPDDAEPTRLFAVACPNCAAEAGVKASRMGSAARCPACRGSFLVPEPRLPGSPAAADAETAAAHAERSPPVLAAPPPPPAVVEPLATLELPAATAGSPELALREPVRTIEAEGRVVVLRRISDEERRRRRARRNIVTLLVGSAILAGLAWLLGGVR